MYINLDEYYAVSVHVSSLQDVSVWQYLEGPVAASA